MELVKIKKDEEGNKSVEINCWGVIVICLCLSLMIPNRIVIKKD